VVAKKAAEKRDKTRAYLLRNVPEDVWMRARLKALLEGRTLRDVIIELLDGWADLEGRFIERPKQPGGRGKKR
jgi:hypothetical protein